MEKILNENEKLRRAEEIYLRRNDRKNNYTSKSKEINKRYVGSKIGFQILILLNIAIIVFCMQNKEQIFKEEFLENLSNFEKNINFKINNILNIFNNQQETIEKIEDIESIKNDENLEEKELNTEIINEKNEDLVPNEEISSSVSQMEIDIQNIKNAYTFVKPIEGIVTSEFGARESKYQKVTGYHTGIDIGAEKGTKIKSSFNGIVSLVSNEGDYGKHVKIRCNNVTLLYAHCSKIYVKEGEFVSEGQEIAEVGSTGNSTGPHLHFEIRVDDRFIDPAKVISF